MYCVAHLQHGSVRSGCHFAADCVLGSRLAKRSYTCGAESFGEGRFGARFRRSRLITLASPRPAGHADCTPPYRSDFDWLFFGHTICEHVRSFVQSGMARRLLPPTFIRRPFNGVCVVLRSTHQSVPCHLAMPQPRLSSAGRSSRCFSFARWCLRTFSSPSACLRGPRTCGMHSRPRMFAEAHFVHAHLQRFRRVDCRMHLRCVLDVSSISPSLECSMSRCPPFFLYGVVLGRFFHTCIHTC